MSSLISRVLDALTDRLLERVKKNPNWSDLGFTNTQEAELNKRDVAFSKVIHPVVVMKPSDFTFPDAAAGVVDPFISIGSDFWQIPYTITNKTTPVFKSLVANLVSDAANPRFMTFEDPVGTDYQVATGKVFYLTRIFLNSQTAGIQHTVGYGDDAVAEGTTAPTTPVYQIGNNTTSTLQATTANITQEFKCYASMPAGKYPFVRKYISGNGHSIQAYGIEVDV